MAANAAPADTRSPYRRQTALLLTAVVLLTACYLGGATITAPVSDPVSWVLHVGVLVISIAAVTLGANWLVDSAVRIANSLGISKVVIGLTVVAFGTSAPEFVVSISAGLQEHGSVAIGNVVGSNIFNLGFILGGVALLVPIVVARQVVYRDGLALLITTGVLFALLWDLELKWWEGAIMFGALILYMGLLFYRKLGKAPGPQANAGEIVQQRTASGRQAVVVQQPPEDFELEEVSADKATWRDIPIFFGGLGAVVAGCYMLVESAIWFAAAMGVPEWAIAVTVVAAGTSAPEMAVSLVAALRGHHEISAGNLIGSDLFNILGVLGLAAMLNHGAGTPLTIEEPEDESKLGLIATNDETLAGPPAPDLMAPHAPAVYVWHVRPTSNGYRLLQPGDRIVGFGEQRFTADEPDPRQRLREYLDDLRLGEQAELQVQRGTAAITTIRVPVGPAKQIRLRDIPDVPESVLAQLRQERQVNRELQAQAGLVPAQWSLLALIGIVLLTVFFMRSGWVVSRVEGAILVLIAISRWVLDLTIH